MASAVAARRRWNGIWAASGALSAALFVAGLVFAHIPPGFPAPDASLERINAYFSDHRAAALGLSVYHSDSNVAGLPQPLSAKSREARSRSEVLCRGSWAIVRHSSTNAIPTSPTSSRCSGQATRAAGTSASVA